MSKINCSLTHVFLALCAFLLPASIATAQTTPTPATPTLLGMSCHHGAQKQNQGAAELFPMIVYFHKYFVVKRFPALREPARARCAAGAAIAGGGSE